MATTAAGTPYVESSDLVANYPGVSLALANHIDTSTGKVLQVVRATDSTVRSTTSGTFVDASISVTITPQKSDSALLIVWNGYTTHIISAGLSMYQITDSSNGAVSGAENAVVGNSSASNFNAMTTLIGYATPGVTTAVTYKVRFRMLLGGTNRIDNATNTGQLYAYEVAA